MTARIESLATATGRCYGAILADPPWHFESYSAKGITQRSAASKYRVARLHELAAIPVAQHVAADCALFLWAVDSHLDQAVELMRAWGFAYKTVAFVWVKIAKSGAPRMSMGLWTRKMSEVCLLGTRGKPRRQSGSVRQIIMAPRREHSRKPDEIYGRIEQLVAGPYLELFARQRWPNWDQRFSDEAERFPARMATA
jgi:N6-adenosine-specific RNA methylase IME4